MTARKKLAEGAQQQRKRKGTRKEGGNEISGNSSEVSGKWTRLKTMILR